MDFLKQYLVPVIIGLCLCAGYVTKHWIKDVSNKIIPTMRALLGILLACWINQGDITPDVILSGAASGLASTGLHEAFKQLLETGIGQMVKQFLSAGNTD